MWARILNYEVAEIIEVNPAGRFHPSLEFVECDESVQVGYFYQGDVFSPKPFDFNSAFEEKNNEIRSAFKTVSGPITSTYTEVETATFPTQINEALAWQADNNYPTPGIDYLVANRPSVDKPTLVGRIIANSATYIDIVFPAMGKKQDYEDQLYALKLQHDDPQQPDVTQADFDAIVVDFS